MVCDAVIVASGSSRRMGFDKLAAPLAGRPVLRHTVEAFLACAEIDRVIVVGPPDRFAELLGDLEDRLVRADGGRERQDSVMAGLAEVRAEYAAIHDGARPLVSPAAISTCLAVAHACDAAALARPVTETMKRADADGFTEDAVDRGGLWHMETPQIFRTELLREAYRAVVAGGLAVTDEVSALEAIGRRTRLVSTGLPNLKITHPGDLRIAAALLTTDARDLP
ncbi:2-C-methyl-D-erythritol 4-phosphate cytidylyltransferase [Haloferula sargassicola]|uniref:2-C-methyl-D-erythritol 4-phosphate cytidylyltransferase n=1 Tax=Haloferula sargassicola TaxID=490096 RepID=A0ABP9UH68_9BACT